MPVRSIGVNRGGRSRRDFKGGTLAPAIECLEELQLLSATPLFSSIPLSPDKAKGVTNPTPYGYTPSQITNAYGFNQITYNNGTTPGNGAGQTIAIVDAYKDPNIAADLQTFDTRFGLPAPPKFTQVIKSGATSNAGWSLEISLDVEWAHAMAPGANILLVEAKSSSLSSLLAGVNTARNTAGVSVVSMSWGAGEFASEAAYDSYFTTPAGHPGVTFVVSSGDGGAGTSWPSVSPNVLSVGGTSLTVGSGGSYVGESTWSGSGGGVSGYESEPNYQTGVQSTGKRTNPDVAYDADPSTGFAVYDTVAYSGHTGWFEIGGTSAGAPQWSALFAIVNQGRLTAGSGPLSNGQAAVYGLPTNAFHDVVTGSTGYAAGPGYDMATGLGSPVVAGVVTALVLAPNPSVVVASSVQAVHQNLTDFSSRLEAIPVTIASARTIDVTTSTSFAPSSEATAPVHHSQLATPGLVPLKGMAYSEAMIGSGEFLVQSPDSSQGRVEPIREAARTSDLVVALTTFPGSAAIVDFVGTNTDPSGDANDSCFTHEGGFVDSIDPAIGTTNRNASHTPAAASLVGLGLFSAWGVRRRVRRRKT